MNLQSQNWIKLGNLLASPIFTVFERQCRMLIWLVCIFYYSMGCIFISRQLMLENSENQPLPSPSAKQPQPASKSTIPLRPSPPNSEKRSVQRLGRFEFSIDQKIGSGMSGQAYVGIDTETFELVCVKVVDRELFGTPEKKALLDNEVRCQTVCNSPHTVKLLDIFDTASFCFIISEFCEGGDLFRCLSAAPHGLPESAVKVFGRQIALALGRLREAGVVHRDIKSENILIQGGRCKLGDFGFAVEAGRLGEGKVFNLGSPLYMSIEALESSVYSYASDVFAFGVVLYEMLHKESPWECADEKQLLEKMKSEEVSFKGGVCEELRQLIRQCLSRKPEDRPTIEEILANPVLAEESTP